MNMGGCARRKLVLAASVLVGLSVSVLAGCGDFWQAPNSNDFTLTNSGNIAVSAGSSGSSTISVTPSNSFTGTVSLSCAVTSPLSASSPATCSLSSSSVSITSTAAQTSTLTAATQSTTTAGDYQLTVTGTSGSASESTTVCVAVGVSASGCSSASGTSGIFYILNSNTVSGNEISAGSLTQLSASTLPSGAGTGNAMAIDPTGNLLYVATTNDIFLYNVGSSGALPTTPTTISQELDVAAIQVDPSGKWLVVAFSTGYISAIPITSAGIEDSGRSAPTPIRLAGIPIQMAISPLSSSNPNVIVAVAQGTAGTQVFPFTSGSTAPIGAPYSPTVAPWGASTTSAASAKSVAIDPQNRFLYIGEIAAFPNSTASTGTGGLRVWGISSTGAKEISGSPYPSGGTGPYAILPESSGNYVYVANWTGNATGYGFQVTSAGALTPLTSTFATGSEPVGLAEDSTNGYVMVVSGQGSPYINAYQFSSSTGSLSSGITSNMVANPVAIVAK